MIKKYYKHYLFCFNLTKLKINALCGLQAFRHQEISAFPALDSQARRDVTQQKSGGIQAAGSRAFQAVHISVYQLTKPQTLK